MYHLKTEFGDQCVAIVSRVETAPLLQRSPKKSMAAADEGPSYESATRDVLLAAGKVIGESLTTEEGAI